MCFCTMYSLFSKHNKSSTSTKIIMDLLYHGCNIFVIYNLFFVIIHKNHGYILLMLSLKSRFFWDIFLHYTTQLNYYFFRCKRYKPFTASFCFDIYIIKLTPFNFAIIIFFREERFNEYIY